MAGALAHLPVLLPNPSMCKVHNPFDDDNDGVDKDNNDDNNNYSNNKYNYKTIIIK